MNGCTKTSTEFHVFRDVQKILHVIQYTTTNYYCKLYLLLQITIPNYHYNCKLYYFKSLLQMILFPLLSETFLGPKLLLTSKKQSWPNGVLCKKAKRKELEKDLSLLRKEAMWTDDVFWGRRFLSEKNKSHHPLGFKQKSHFWKVLV